MKTPYFIALLSQDILLKEEKTGGIPGSRKAITRELDVYTFAEGQFALKYKDHLFAALFGLAYHQGKGEKGEKIVELVIDKNDNVTYLDDFLRYIGQGPANVCGLAFGPDGLYFTDLHGEVGFKKGERSGGNIWKIAKI